MIRSRNKDSPLPPAELALSRPYGRDYPETHFSPLKQINADNVSFLALVRGALYSL
jgi:glucose dehydrogenase